MDFDKKISDIEKKIHYTFRDKSLLRQAFTRTSYCNEKNYRGRDNYSSNEVLEFFGDSVLSTAIISVLLDKKTERYRHGIKTALTEGDMSNIRSKLSDKRNLSRSMAVLGLHKLLMMGEGDEKLGISEEASVMEDLFESIVGAVYIDCEMSMPTVIGVVKSMLDVDEYLSGEAPLQSYKNALQEWCADKKRRLPPPVYQTVSERGPDHKKVYERGCYVDGKLWGVGKGKNQKLADAQAAEAALAALKESYSDDSPRRENALTALRELANKEKVMSPEYHDLGEAPGTTDTSHRYVVECCFKGMSVSGIASAKQDAREIAASKMLELIEKASHKAAPEKKPTLKAKTAESTRAAKSDGQNQVKQNAARAQKKTAKPAANQGSNVKVAAKPAANQGNNTKAAKKRGIKSTSNPSTKARAATVSGTSSAKKSFKPTPKVKKKAATTR